MTQPLELPTAAAAEHMLDDATRLLRLAEETNRRLMNGWTVVSREETTATVVLARPGKGVSHLLHFFISLFTLGIWLPVWLLLAIFQRREKRLMLTVDPTGRVIERKS